MGRRKKAKEVEPPIDQNERVAVGGNGFDRDETQGFVDRIENLHADIATIMSEAMTRCRAVHEDLKIVYQEAKDEAGLPKKVLKKVVKARLLEAKAQRVREDLESEDQDSFDRIRQALGDLADLPLGAAALAAVPQPATSQQDF